jgi:hypothetical protein
MSERLPRTLLHAAPPAALFALACALLAPASPATPGARRAGQGHEQATRRRPPEPESVVYGRAVYDDTSRPVRRARVMLVAETGSRPEYNGLTDSDGNFAIYDVSPGTYYAFADVPGALSPVAFVSFGELRGRGTPDFSEARRFFDVVEVDGREDSRVTVHARRGGALSGRVTYADGDPAVNVGVSVMRRGPGGRLEKFITGINIVSISSLRTDDRGLFRVSGLPPGEYLVGAAEQADHSGRGKGGGRGDPMESVLEGLVGQQLLTTFYPSATSAKEAAVLKVEAGVEREGVDIRIPERALHSVRGVVRGARDRRALAGAKVTIVRRGDGDAGAESFSPGGEAPQNSDTTDPEGRWMFTDIPEGDYTIFVKPREEYEEVPAVTAAANMNTTVVNANANMVVSNVNTSVASVNMNGVYTPPRRKRGYAPVRRDVRVSDADVSEVAFELNEGGRISGTVTFEGAATEYGYLGVRRAGEGDEDAGSGETWTAGVSAGRFEVGGLPAGKFVLRFTNYGDEEGLLYVKSVTWNGRDFTREPLELGEGASAEGVRVVVSGDAAKLRVLATDSAHKASARGVVIVLLPADESGASARARRFSCFTEEGGACVVTAPPGEYRVVALPSSSNTGSFAEELARRAATAPRVTLAAGEAKGFVVASPEK